MKAIWNILALFAVANLIGLGAFVGWLVASDRLNQDRARAIRASLTTTITAEARAKADAEAKAAREAAEAAAQAKADRPPLTAAEMLQARLETTELDRQRAARLRREVEDLQSVLTQERFRLDQAHELLRRERAAFEAVVTTQSSTIQRQQFEKSLSVLTALKPADAKTALREVIRGVPGILAVGPTPGQDAPTDGAGMVQAVEYLNAIDDRARARIIGEFLKEDPPMAAQLLERLRTLGLPQGAEPAPRAEAAAAP